MKQGILVAALALAFQFGPAYNTYLDFHFTHSTDATSYLAMAQGNLDVNPTHRYRIVVPALAAGVAWVVRPFYNHLWDFRPDPIWAYRLGFLVINSIFMAMAGSFIFFTCLAYGAGKGPSLIALLAILSSRWADYMAALPLTDSLYFLVLAMFLYGLKARNPAVLVGVAVLGPLAKESFLFVAPLLFLGPWGWRKPAWLLLLSGLFAWTIRFGIDQHLHKPMLESWRNDFSHTEGIGYALNRFFLHRLGEKFSVLGLFTLIGVVGMTGGAQARKAWMGRMDLACVGMVGAVLVHVLLSGDVGRMLFLGGPVWAVALALILEYHPRVKALTQNCSGTHPKGL